MKNKIEKIYENRQNFVVIGLTGKTGSGCSTVEQKSNIKKFGDDFEKYVGKKYEDNGYEVEYRGLNLGFLDG
ncbi:hypothetical protein CRU87_08230, partial [Aliarcobacter trophiarum LMG 25534]